MCGGYVSVDYVIETVEHAIPHGENYAKLKKELYAAADAGLW